MTPNDTPAPQDPRDLQIAAMTVAGRSTAEIASEVSVSPSTVKRTRARFRDWIDQSRSEVAERVSADLLDLCSNASAALGGLLTARNENVRLGAIRTVLDAAAKWRDSTDIERRISALESERGPGHGWQI